MGPGIIGNIAPKTPININEKEITKISVSIISNKYSRIILFYESFGSSNN